MNEILLAFIPIFVAVDPIGLLPVFVSLTHQIKPERKRKVIGQSLLTAVSLAVAFIFTGKAIFHLLGITEPDFMIAGGIVLICLAIADLMNPENDRRKALDEPGVVPIGTPLIVGPAVLTTSLIMINQYGTIPTLIAILLNLGIVGMIFLSSEALMRVIGKSGARALSKIMGLFLAAIAVMMIRKGIFILIFS